MSKDKNIITRRKFLAGVGMSAVVTAADSAAPRSASSAANAAPAVQVISRSHEIIRFPAQEVAYVVANPKSDFDTRLISRLKTYFEATLGRRPREVSVVSQVPAHRPAIILAHSGQSIKGSVAPPAGSPEGYALFTGRVDSRPVVVALGNTSQGLKRAVQKLVLKIRQEEGGLEFPPLHMAEKPWIPEREWALCSWEPRWVRGVFVNPYADERKDLFRYSDQRLAEYVAMYDWFGFSGVQLLDACYNYAVWGSVEAFQERLKRLARNAKANDQSLSLWVWGAEFSHFGWVDPSLVYTPSAGHTAFNDPRVRKGFEKYYTYYAELAPLVDRLIAHFYDPGNLTNRQDVFSYMRLLENKFKARNPHIKMSIDMWAAGPDYFQQLVDNGFKDYLVLEQPHGLKPGKREAIHREAKRLGMKLGMWGWYSTEMETDQLASMYVNAQVLKGLYQQVKQSAAEIYPLQYWSEMEANHLNNIYSTYAASQLLWNPDREPHEILGELTEGIWGPRNGPKVLKALEFIKDVRSGPSWETYWWRSPKYRVGSADPATDVERAESALGELSEMATDEKFVPKFPLPVSSGTLVELILPHLRQIRAFACFRVGLDRVKAKVEGGMAKQQVAKEISRIWTPIPEYGTWVGTFGQRERRLQEILLRKWGSEIGVEFDPPGWLQAQEADRLLQKIQNAQRAQRAELRFQPKGLNEFWWPEDKLQARLEMLIGAGWVEKLDSDQYRLVNWDQYTCSA